MKPGHNKVNVIILKADNREVESGDASIYLGRAGEPDLILVSPRDRQVFAGENIGDLKPVSISVPIKGITSCSEIFIDERFSINIKADGSFGDNKYLHIKEGNNILNIKLIGNREIYITKTVLGAFLFRLGNKESYILRRGDLVFNGTTPYEEGVIFGIPAIPMDPDHTGIYTGDGEITEAIFPFVTSNNISKWDDDGFYYAVQVPRLVGEKYRKEVCDEIKSKKGYPYKVPIHFVSENGLPTTIAGHYSPGQGGFYCSELAFWAWLKVANINGLDIGIKKVDLYFPNRYNGNDNSDSVLPAYLCEKSMEVRRFK